MSNDTIYGLDTDTERCDLLMFRMIRKDYQEYEKPLFSSKWFDYRFMHPVQATYLYAHEFTLAYRRFFRSTISRAAAETIRIQKKEDLFDCEKAYISAIWRGRQHADAMGIPYDAYIDFAMTKMLNNWNRSHLPQAATLYSGEVCEYVQAQWETRQGETPFIGKHPEFKLNRYVGTPHQNDHHEWLLAQVEKRQSASRIMLSQLYNDELLPMEKIVMRFGPDVASMIQQTA
jgi:hypothetical protein